MDAPQTRRLPGLLTPWYPPSYVQGKFTASELPRLPYRYASFSFGAAALAAAPPREARTSRSPDAPGPRAGTARPSSGAATQAGPGTAAAWTSCGAQAPSRAMAAASAGEDADAVAAAPSNPGG